MRNKQSSSCAVVVGNHTSEHSIQTTWFFLPYALSRGCIADRPYQLGVHRSPQNWYIVVTVHETTRLNGLVLVGLDGDCRSIAKFAIQQTI